MRRARFWSFLAVLLVPALALWALSEVRSQQREVEEALRAEAALLAHTLGPALASASAAARELDELLSWKLLDNARLLARLEARSRPAGPPEDPAGELATLAEENGLETVVVLAPGGGVLQRTGRPVDEAALRARLAPVLRGEADELILGAASEAEHLAAAVATRDGGAVAVLASPARAYAFTRQIGTANLLHRLVDTRAVLYLVYEEHPGDVRAEASWDGQPVPPAPTTVLRDRPVFEVAVPVSSPAGREASLRVGLNGEPLRRSAASALRRTVLVGLVLAAFGLSSAGFTLVQRARAREREESRRRFAELEEDRRRGERLAAAGAIAAGLAHEVRNPLNGIGMAAQRIERLSAPEERTRQLAALIRQEVSRLEAKLKEFLDLARPSSGPREDADLAQLTREALATLELEAAGRGIFIEAPADGPWGQAVILADVEAVRGALVNLVRNALQASPPGGRVEVAVEETEGMARVVVRDHGGGLDPGLGERAFDAFVTTRAEGTGLGLALVRRVAEEHGGRCRLRNHPGGGVEAVLEIPIRSVQGAERTVA